MDTYKKLKAVQALVASLDEQIYRGEQFKKIDKQTENNLVEEYFVAIKELMKS